MANVSICVTLLIFHAQPSAQRPSESLALGTVSSRHNNICLRRAVQDERQHGHSMRYFNCVNTSERWEGRVEGAHRVWVRHALPGVSCPSSYVTVNLQGTAQVQVEAAAAGHPSLHGESSSALQEPETYGEQALTFSREAAALELFPVWSIPEGVENDVLMQPWTISLVICTAYSGLGLLHQHWEIRQFERQVQAVPVQVTNRKALIAF